MKDYKCAHCAHCNEIKYDGFFCDKTGYVEHKRIEDKCKCFEADTIDQLAKMVTEKLVAAYPKGAEFTVVRHGRWLSYTGTHYTGKENEYGDPEYKEHIFFVCSNCRRKTVVRENFCPNCGADMREVSEDACARTD